MFEKKVSIPGHGEVLIRFKKYSHIPGRISRRFARHQEIQLWASLEWGVTEPKRWPDTPFKDDEKVPTHSTAIADGLLDDVPMDQVMDLHNEWMRYAGVTEGESDASSE